MEYPHHQSLRLQNFTCFKDCEMNFSPGINVFIGENGTGKTHVMKALYARNFRMTHANEDFSLILKELFQYDEIQHLYRNLNDQVPKPKIEGKYSNKLWHFGLEGPGPWTESSEDLMHPWATAFEKFNGVIGYPVFVPAIDMMGHTKHFIEAADMVPLDFDLTCINIVAQLMSRTPNRKADYGELGFLSPKLEGALELSDDGRFHIASDRQTLPITLFGEGIRKIATLLQLYKSGWLEPGTILFWDEPEVNLNPQLMDELVEALLILSRSGVQIFLATHSYVILKELDLHASREDKVLYHAFGKCKECDEGTKVTSTEEFSQITPNPILDQYTYLYDRELTKATGRTRNAKTLHSK